METVKRLSAVLVFVIAFPYFLAAQNSNTHVAKINGEFLLSQTITFLPVPDMLYYKVEIEQLVTETFLPLDTIRTETNSIDVSLKAGSYRYRIFAYNRMNLLDGVSEWREFEVFAAVEPALETYQPFYGLYYELPDFARSITVRGRGFFPESEFALVKRAGEFDWSEINLEDRKDALFPEKVTVNDDHTLATLDFSLDGLKRGEYYIFVRNPGGLWTTLGRVRVGFKKNTDWTFSFGWSPMIAAFDRSKDIYHEDTHYSYYYSPEEKRRLDLFNPRGGYVRLGWFPVKTKIGNFGLELNWLFLADKKWVYEHEDPTAWDYFGALSGGHVDIVYQRAFSSWKNWQLEVRVGVGGGNEYEDDYIHDEEAAIPFPLLLNFGVSTQYFIWRNFYAEAGLDFQYMTGVDHVMIWPAIGLGWQFGRWAEVAAVDKALKRGEDPSVPVKNIPENEVTLSLGWSPVIPLSDFSTTKTEYGWIGPGPYNYGAYEEKRDPELERFNPAGAYFRVAYLPHRWGGNKLGFEYAFFILDFPERRNYDDNVLKWIGLVHNSQFNILYQRKLPKDWQLNARFGIGFGNPHLNEPGVAFNVNTGLSVQRFFWRGLYVEAGLDISASFYDETPRWILIPAIGIGWQFSLDAETGLRLK